MVMQQQISIITLGVDDIGRSRRFYGDGFGWSPVFETDEIVFYQMNGLMLGTWLRQALNGDMNETERSGSSSYALAHNVAEQQQVAPLIEQLVAAGGTLMSAASAPPHGGFRGYVADPDGHPWEIAWNPAWTIDDDGHVTFGV